MNKKTKKTSHVSLTSLEIAQLFMALVELNHFYRISTPVKPTNYDLLEIQNKLYRYLADNKQILEEFDQAKLEERYSKSWGAFADINQPYKLKSKKDRKL